MTKEYNDQGQLISTTWPDGDKYIYEYDERGNLISITNPNGDKQIKKMTRETAKSNLEFITAFANGEEIQFLSSDGEWYDHDEPMFIEKGRYRVKPKRVFALYNKMTKEIEYLSENEQNVINFLIPCGWVKVELVKFDK